MATTTISPNSMIYRTSSSAYPDYTKIYDGVDTTYTRVGNTGAGIVLGFSLASIPQNHIITAITYRVRAKRKSSKAAMVNITLQVQNGGTRTPLGSAVTLPDYSEFDTAVWKSATKTIDATDSTALRNADIPCISLTAGDYNNLVYEVYLDVEHEEAQIGGNIYVGNTQASAVYVGTTKASAVYVGTTKVL